MKTFKSFFMESKVRLEDAVRAYTAVGGEYEDKYEYIENQMFDVIANAIKSHSSKTLYRGYSVDESDIEDLQEYEWKKGSKNLIEGLASFTTERGRAAGFGAGDFKILLEIKIKTYLELGKMSLYPQENEFLTNNLKWTPTKEPVLKGSIYYVYGTEI